ncbi:hypothetical protein [Hymenobacter latericus]|uniref:hypothetical protein n=1 Tax=Hymenobacter sp. YIM 151858-1 TaxID=2987688 RepID=UPI0022277D77|nr:hypothetical protein [Hymenobacter sp. YIM 151858-1]UYZ59092.1 hypothetical protein OIS50_18785 [Hymenobacter sp. YIM 151858-1]
MRLKRLSELPPRIQGMLDKLLLAALVLLVLISMRSCVRNVADAIGLGTLTAAEHQARERSHLPSD